MNFLAHALLSGSDADILLGNLMADFLGAGEKIHHQLPQVQRGIAWHYQIDRFMDSHPLVAQGRARLFPEYRHYSAVLVDVFYDHLLARNWDSFSAVPLSEFAPWVYRTLETRRDECPESFAQIIPHLISDDWLRGYAVDEGVLHALTRLQKRGTRGVMLTQAWDDFDGQRALFEAEFREFFPQIQRLGRENGALS